MKRLTCELCGSNDLIKQDGYYVCQYCDTKYSVEDARKLMIEGTVDVTGSTVKVDSTDELANLYELARRARQTSNSEDAAKYYDLILVKDPTSWEATFYSTYYKAASCKIINITSAAISVGNVLPTVVLMIDKYEEDKEAAMCEVINQTIKICWMLYSGAKSHFIKYFDNSGAASEAYKRVTTCAKTLAELGSAFPTTVSVNAQNSEKIKKNLILAYETAQKMYADHYNTYYQKYPAKASNELRPSLQKVIDVLENDFIKPLDDSHTKPILESVNVQGKTSGGCYVATAVYGSYNCPQVWTLRRFRDYTLAETWYGRVFIRTYYAISPTLVKWFGDTAWFESMWKPTLDRMVEKLNSKGIEDTPYNDRNW